jgi:hypothetical protein
MNIFNKITMALFDILFFPFRHTSSLWGVLIFAILTGFFMLWIFKKVSDQEGIRTTKDHIKAHLLEIHLYRHDALLSLEAMGQLFGANGRYLLHLVKPLLVMSVPMLIFLIQLGARYGHRPAAVGQPILFAVRHRENIDPEQISLVAPGVQIETSPLLIPQENVIYWRIRPLAGTSILTLRYRDKAVHKKLVIGDDHQPLAAKRVPARALSSLFYPAEPALAVDSFVTEIQVDYPETIFQVAGVRFHWLLFFVVVSLLASFMAKRLFKVQL